MKRLIFVITCTLLLLNGRSIAQRSCGYELVHKAALAKNPNFDADREAYLKATYKSGAAKKTTSTTTLYVPIVFHIVLNDACMAQMDPTTLQDRINTQIEVLNEDYNRGNADSTLIPSAFKPVYDNVNIKFALTRKDPNGNPTPGYEIIHTTVAGFDITSSADPGGDAKHTSTGGADSWDVTKYINVWVINFSPASVIGLTVNPSYTIAGTYPVNEMGTLLSYQAFGKRTSSSEYFLGTFDQGRTLTHELGHYFELIHIWGDDGGACPGSGGTDDGIADTPPQANYTYGCPAFPKTDACSSTSPGIMFMNFMDYADDACMHMFTHDQAVKMHANLEAPSGESYPLTTHPDLLSVPEPNNLVGHDLLLSPNPTKGVINITFGSGNSTIQSIAVFNAMGQFINKINTLQNNNFYTIDLSGMPKGLYFVECNYTDGKEVRKIVLQ